MNMNWNQDASLALEKKFSFFLRNKEWKKTKMQSGQMGRRKETICDEKRKKLNKERHEYHIFRK